MYTSSATHEPVSFANETLGSSDVVIPDKFAIDIKDDITESQIDFGSGRILDNFRDENLLAVFSSAFHAETESSVDEQAGGSDGDFQVIVRLRGRKGRQGVGGRD